jgi:ubiquinone/menaquinone biosynthesis C-methylase UbiE
MVCSMPDACRQAKSANRQRIKYVHKLAEASGLPDKSCDVVFFGFVAREVPASILRAFIKESARILRPGGALIFADDNQG